MTTLTFQPDAAAGIDTWIDYSRQNRNLGVSTVCHIGSGFVNVAGRGLLKFDISALPTEATIISAILTLTCTMEGSSTDHSVGVYRALTEWFEGIRNGTIPAEDGSTWDFRNHNGSVPWGTEGGQSGVDYAAVATDIVAITGINVAFDWDVLADVHAWHTGEAVNYGWFLINTAEDTVNSWKTFPTSDYAAAALRPKLVITYSIPSTGDIYTVPAEDRVDIVEES